MAVAGIGIAWRGGDVLCGDGACDAHCRPYLESMSPFGRYSGLSATPVLPRTRSFSLPQCSACDARSLTVLVGVVGYVWYVALVTVALSILGGTNWRRVVLPAVIAAWWW
jgi:hypothetical protein